MSQNINNDAFQVALRAIAKGGADAKAGIVKAFRAAMNDLYESKSVDRINQLTTCVKASAISKLWPTIQAAAYLFAGGYEVDHARLLRYRVVDRSILRFDKRQSTWEMVPCDKDDWQRRLAEYDLIRNVAYDELTAKPRPEDRRITAEPLRRLVDKLAKSRERWDSREAALLNKAIAALKPLLAEASPEIDADMLCASQVSGLNGAPLPAVK